jgi:pyridoxal phosphate enzyme (YggS family)
MTDVAENLRLVRSKLEETCLLSGRDPGEVALVAISKGFPVEKVREASDAGQEDFGENRIQEARDKIPEGPPGLTWHMVGTLQKNKVKYAVKLFDWIHSVDSLELAGMLDQRLGPLGRTMNGLIQVKLSPEPAKFGISLEELNLMAAGMREMKNLKLRGLMTMPPYDPDPETSRPYFSKLKELSLQLAGDLDLQDFDHLSMGMSHDFTVAVEEGATMIRIGTAIFGPRF